MLVIKFTYPCFLFTLFQMINHSPEKIAILITTPETKLFKILRGCFINAFSNEYAKDLSISILSIR
ncbi:MAG: hypothetical protein DCF17_07525 [Shackletoniella antarctica]|uniref:Uncharacterized protein n=1 Tax=Shackletoniella antarctica TaxID=268115 RepID=A0A2W4WEG0_9CYAN|nr:MAG: hypothetical protein DCF17_07525 [Shackletoniella antarctica]